MTAMPKKALHLAGALGHLAADKRVEILRQVGQGGSISQAARDAGVSYKAAWQALDTLSNLAGAALVERAVGGSGGGGARLTAQGEQLLRVAQKLAWARDRALGELSGAGSPALAAVGLRTSMRNQLPCTVQVIEELGQMARARLQLAGGAVLVSRITRESAELLGLRRDQQVLALCKATAVSVSRAAAAGTLRAGKSSTHLNLLPGRAKRVSRGASGDEVAAELDAGLQLVGFASSASGLRSGSRVVMGVDESAVVIALAG